MIEGLHSKFEQIRRNFCHFENFVLKTGFLAQRVARRARPIGLGGPNHKWLVVLDFS